MLNVLIYAIILVFSYILREYLTPVSFILLAFSSSRLFSKRILNQFTINIVCLFIFIYYIVTFGRVITPEIGLNFLFNITLLKFMESKKFRDDVMCIFGTILLVSSGSLFDKTLVYFIFFIISFFLLIFTFFKLNRIELFNLKNIKTYLKLSLFTAVLFFVFPRIPNPIPFTLNSGDKGEIGYSPEINISSIEELLENDSKVFWAKLSSGKSREELYWRGNVLSDTDGWNWMPGELDQGGLEVSRENVGDSQEYRLFIKTPYLFVHDEASVIKVNHKVYKSDDTNSFNSSYLKNTSRYYTEKTSSANHSPSKEHLYHNLGESTLSWINRTFKDEGVDEIIEEFKEFILKEKFSYSWTPGKIRSLDEFASKKIGFCTHYASSLALILRAKNHPARLVSGFQGGRYNPYGNFYEVSQNDAHAWVEVNKNGKWVRVDPTSFIAPERIIMDYQEVVNNNFIIPRENSLRVPMFFNDLKFLISQWDFEFYQVMDQWDATVQVSFFSRFKLTRGRLYALSVLMLLTVCLILFKGKKRFNSRQKQWMIFMKLLSNNGIHYQGSFEKLREDITQSEWEKRALSLVILDHFINLFYADDTNIEEIKAKLKVLNQ